MRIITGALLGAAAILALAALPAQAATTAQAPAISPATPCMVAPDHVFPAGYPEGCNPWEK
ncbi:hypothetical protein [Actinomadura gamaensis]|uniref:Uncharacterized protein n=1 Tax=Actinomadura gamaensis TaxID=1763541 RepID=A0ABV9UCW8_9ACTN